jgi:hypothetical protein
MLGSHPSDKCQHGLVIMTNIIVLLNLLFHLLAILIFSKVLFDIHYDPRVDTGDTVK